MKRILFIDRDGTIIMEPKDNFQVDSFEKLSFLPNAISALKRIVTETDYRLVMVTNQDGLGTKAFPEKKFHGPHQLMLTVLEKEGIHFDEICIDKTFAKDNALTRKPNTGMLTHYLGGTFDLSNSYVIGDRLTDIQLAKNLGTKGILIGRSSDKTDDNKLNAKVLQQAIALKTNNWNAIADFLCSSPPRVAQIQRNTNETKISVNLNLDGKGQFSIKTGLGFFDHMLEQLAKHSGVDLQLKVKGDLHIDEHHTIEDTAIALGEAFYQALGNKKGIQRYGFLLPMDDVLAQVAIDFSGRSWLVWKVNFKREQVGDMPTEMFYHFWKSFSDAAKCNLNIKAEGNNEHHKIEAIFKAVAKAIKQAIKVDGNDLPSTKGTL